MLPTGQVSYLVRCKNAIAPYNMARRRNVETSEMTNIASVNIYSLLKARAVDLRCMDEVKAEVVCSSNLYFVVHFFVSAFGGFIVEFKSFMRVFRSATFLPTRRELGGSWIAGYPIYGEPGC